MSSDLPEDAVGCCRPDEECRIFVVAIQVVMNGLIEIAYVAKRTAPDAPLLGDPDEE